MKYETQTFAANTGESEILAPPAGLLPEAVHDQILSSPNISKSLILLKSVVLFFALLSFWKFGMERRERFPMPNFCLKDYVFEMLDPINIEIHENTPLLRFFQITSSGLVDLFLLFFGFIKLVRTPTGYPLYTLGVFYGVRAAIQGTFGMRFPDGGIWDYPGVPSVTVPYGLTRDFYYSGHCGFLAISSYMMFTEKFYVLALFGALAIPYVGFVLTLTRIHYSIDIPIGVLCGIYVSIILEKKSSKIDNLFRVLLCARFWKNLLC